MRGNAKLNDSSKANHPGSTAIGAGSTLIKTGSIDGRSTEGKFLSASRRELIAHLGGNPSIAQRVLIDRIGLLRLRLTKLDAKIAGPDGLSEWEGRSYITWSNALSRALRTIGLEGRGQRQPPLLEAMGLKGAA